MFNYTALALRQAGRQAGSTAWHGIQLAAQNGGKCPLHPALPAESKPWQGSWAEPLAPRSQTPRAWLMGQHLNCCAQSHTFQNRIAPVWAHPQPQGQASNALASYDASERWARLDNKMPPRSTGVFSDCNLAAACWRGSCLVTIMRWPEKKNPV